MAAYALYAFCRVTDEMADTPQAVADPDRAAEGTLSQKAVRAVRFTPDVSCVLVGMRREEYVADVLAELRHPIKQKGRLESWRKLTAELANTAL